MTEGKRFPFWDGEEPVSFEDWADLHCPIPEGRTLRSCVEWADARSKFNSSPEGKLRLEFEAERTRYENEQLAARQKVRRECYTRVLSDEEMALLLANGPFLFSPSEEDEDVELDGPYNLSRAVEIQALLRLSSGQNSALAKLAEAISEMRAEMADFKNLLSRRL